MIEEVTAKTGEIDLIFHVWPLTSKLTLEVGSRVLGYAHYLLVDI